MPNEQVNACTPEVSADHRSNEFAIFWLQEIDQRAEAYWFGAYRTDLTEADIDA